MQPPAYGSPQRTVVLQRGPAPWQRSLELATGHSKASWLPRVIPLRYALASSGTAWTADANGTVLAYGPACEPSRQLNDQAESPPGRAVRTLEPARCSRPSSSRASMLPKLRYAEKPMIRPATCSDCATWPFSVARPTFNSAGAPAGALLDTPFPAQRGNCLAGRGRSSHLAWTLVNYDHDLPGDGH